MKVLYNRREEWIVSKGKDIAVGDGSKKTFHYIMGSWYDEEGDGDSGETIANVIVKRVKRV